MKISEIQDIANLNGIPALQDDFASLYLTIINNFILSPKSRQKIPKKSDL